MPINFKGHAFHQGIIKLMLSNFEIISNNAEQN